MPKPTLIPEDDILERQLIETMKAGLHEWRPDLDYPESYSDFQACTRGLLRMFKIMRLPLNEKLRIPCHTCEGLGYLIVEVDGVMRRTKTCPTCEGKRIA